MTLIEGNFEKKKSWNFGFVNIFFRMIFVKYYVGQDPTLDNFFKGKKKKRKGKLNC